MRNTVRNFGAGEVQYPALNATPRNGEFSLLEFSENCKWVRLSYKRGKYHYQCKTLQGHFHYAIAPTLPELENQIWQRIKLFQHSN